LEELEEEDGPVESVGEALDYTSKATNGFASFNLPEPLIERMTKLGYNKPFEIQQETLKHTLEGRDLVGKAFTGSGKTLAFAIPIINKIFHSENISSISPKCLVLAPTRELCLQLSAAIIELAPGLKCVSVYGGTGLQRQMRELEGKVDIVCATPGRLQDLINRNSFKTDNIEIICLDEADQLLNNSFLPQIEYLIEKTDKKKQLLMFSATINKNIIGLVNNYMKNPVLVDLTKGQKHKLPTNIEHFATFANRHSVANVAKHFIESFQSERCIVFTNRKIQAAELSRQFQRMNIRSADLHSDISQDKRERILTSFRSGSLKVIFATDVAARGIDIPEIDLILHVDPPQNGIDFYIHRSGRTGRGGRPGKSVIIDTGAGTGGDGLDELSRVIKFKKLIVPSEVTKASSSSANEFEQDEGNHEYGRRSVRENRFGQRHGDAAGGNAQFRKEDIFNSRSNRGSGGAGGGSKFTSYNRNKYED
jgi:superfamily II DNA/RNA helicase